MCMNTEVNTDYININSKKECILTPREVEYLGLVALGFHNSQIAKILYVSFYTVKKTLEKIFEKLHAIDRANAVAIAFIHKILNTKILTGIVKTHNIRTQIFVYL